jgi:hypothetical protein
MYPGPPVHVVDFAEEVEHAWGDDASTGGQEVLGSGICSPDRSNGGGAVGPDGPDPEVGGGLECSSKEQNLNACTILQRVRAKVQNLLAGPFDRGDLQWTK